MHSFRKSRVFKYTVRPGAVLLLCECVHKSAGALVPQVCVWYHYISCGFAGGGAITAGQWKAFEVAGFKALGVSQISDSVTAPCYCSVLFRK